MPPADPLKEVLKDVHRYSPFRILLFWAVFAIVVALCASVIKADVTYGKVLDADCAFSAWSEWKGCEALDCSAVAIRTRTLLQQPSGEGALCVMAHLIETSSCNDLLLNVCGNIGCQYTNWSNWSACPDSCIVDPKDCANLPSRVRTRSVLRAALPGGAPCDWNTLVQTTTCENPSFCSLTRQCIPGAFAPDFSQCEIGCPPIGCTLTENPFWTYCTLTNTIGPDSDCNPGQLLYSRTCAYPNCTETCQANNYMYFSRCSVPCGPGTYVSSTGLQCPTLNIESCSLADCSKGSMIVLDPSTTASTADPSQICTVDVAGNPNFSALELQTRCLARCASSQTCNYAWVNQAMGNVTLSSGLPTLPPLYLWSYSAESTECITPNWEMVGATCLYVCEETSANLLLNYFNGQPFSEERGLVFPFSNGQLSCPIKSNLLSEMCPNTNNAILDLGGVGRAPYLMQQYENNSTRFRTLFGVTYTCPASVDCKYQSWSAAEPWGLCSDATHGQDIGLRTRIRRVISPPTFLGNPCDIGDMTEQVPCNRPTAMCSATDMWCTFSSDNYMTNSSEYACHYVCSESRAQFGKDACNSIFTYANPTTLANEVFLASYSVNFLNSDLSAQSVPVPPNYRVAYYAEVADAWARGMQVCDIGWAYQVTNDPTSLPLLLASVQQEQCEDYDANSLSIITTALISNKVFLIGDKAKFSDAGLTVSISPLPFFDPTAAPSPFDPLYTFSTQTLASDVNCALLKDRSDRVIHSGACTSLTAAPFASMAAHLTSSLLDIPYSLADNCSVTDWVSDILCGGDCVRDSVSTRSYISPATQGGRPCSQFPLFTQSQCPTFQCSINFINVCIPASLPTRTGYSCDNASFGPDVYLEEFNTATIYNWAAQATSFSLDVKTFFSTTIRSNALGGSLDANVYDALNSQCVFDCVQPPGSTQYYTLTADGWRTVPTCTTDPLVQQSCVQSRGSATPPGKQVYDLQSGWVCPSTCRPSLGLSLSCDFGIPPIASCSCIGNGETMPPPQTTVLPFRTSSLWECNDGKENLQTTWTFGCAVQDAVQCEYNPNCPLGNDGTQCNEYSEFGVCNAVTNRCVCNAGPDQDEACNRGCRINPTNGLTCSIGPQACTFSGGSFSCICPSFRSGALCQTAGLGIVGLLENLLYTGTAVLLNDDSREFVSYTFINPEPRCEDNPGYCLGAQVYGPADRFPFYDPTNFMLAANVCVNSQDATFDSQTWVGNRYLSRNLDVPCEQVTTTDGFLQTQLVFTLTGRFRSHSAIPPALHGKQFFTRCPPGTQYQSAFGNKFSLQNTVQSTSKNATTSYLFDIINAQGQAFGLSNLVDICTNTRGL